MRKIRKRLNIGAQGFLQRKYAVGIMLTVIILLQLAVAAFYMDKKQYFNCDELFSFEGAHNAMLYPFNSNGLPYRLDHSLSAYYKWIPKSDLMRHFEVWGEERLLAHSLKDICHNIKVHNTFYIMLNIVLSFRTSGTFTKWYGYALNAIIFLAHQIVLYLMGREIFKNRKQAFLAVILYGFSAGGITTTVFIRFYLLMSLFCMLIAYAHIHLINCKNIKNIVMAFVVTGTTTLSLYENQPYIMLYAAMAILIFGVICLIQKSYKFLFKYIGIGLAIAVLVLIFEPGILQRVRGMAQSSWGIEAIEALFERPLKEYIEYLVFFFTKSLAHITAGIYGILAIAVIIVGAWIIQGRNHIRFLGPNMPISALYIILVALAYFFVNARIQSAFEYRYMTCIYVGWCVCAVVVLEWLLGVFKICHCWAVYGLMVAVMLIISYQREYVDEVYPNISAALQQMEKKYANVDSLFIKPKDSVVRLYYDGVSINDGTSLYLMEPDDLETADYTFVEDTYDNGMLVWIPILWEEDPEYRNRVLDTVLVRTEYKSYDKLFETEPTYGSSVYYMH